MESQLHQALRSLCFDNAWKYAIFWKLTHKARMTLTCEDAYYENEYREASGSLLDGSSPHDPLRYAVAMMSYQVYSLGEGILGRAAVSGEHSWILSDELNRDSSSSFEDLVEWHNQFSAGVKTVAVVPVNPYGVVQLGSLHKIVEDLKLVSHIKDVFSELQDPFAGFIPYSSRSNPENSYLSDVCSRIPNSANFHDHVAKLDNSFHEDEMSLWSQLFSSVGLNQTLRTTKNERAECSVTGNNISLTPSSQNIFTRKQKEERAGSSHGSKSGEETRNFKDHGKMLENMNFPFMKNASDDKFNLVQDQGEFHIPEIPNEQFHQVFAMNQELHNKSDGFETNLSSYRFYAGYELYEALGPSFQSQNDFVWEEKTGSEMAVDASEDMCRSGLFIENPDVQLLDALVAKVSHNEAAENVKLLCDTEGSLLSAESMPCPTVGSTNSASYSLDRVTSSSLNSVICSTESTKDFLSPSSSRGSECVERGREPVKMNKKRSKTGEHCRPRPRDRQLIQDRIKELRDLVPSGSKCSIDSLLERTIKHMLFLQSITKHAEKLHKCSVSKLLDKDPEMRRFSFEPGSSWAVEVGDDPKVCPIIVENINTNGQMLVEMLCDQQSSQFPDMAETIRSLGLTILKGISEARGSKTWMCFVVEGQNNLGRSLHRLDVLWPLMQLLQSKTTN